MAAVAQAASVATQTMYFSFGSKAALLQEVMVAKRTGPGEHTEVVARDWFADAMAAADQRRSLALGVEGGTDVLRRLSPIAPAMTSAELADDQFAAVMHRIRGERRSGMSRLVDVLDRTGGLSTPTTVAVDVVDVVQSMGTYRALVGDCGWTPELYKAWAYRTLTQLLRAIPPRAARKLDVAATADLPYHQELVQLLPD